MQQNKSSFLLVIARDGEDLLNSSLHCEKIGFDFLLNHKAPFPHPEGTCALPELTCQPAVPAVTASRGTGLQQE